ncbi:DIP1984 family protein [Humidisolicoccus flavus]|uniref:DIP1984 family protein n=1 Tax=Humidisolicoccus flavus TaxID=3111414 RepID=UPI003253FC9E
MKLAEALLERADLQKRLEALQSRVIANASFQEGEEPAEDAGELLQECERTLAALETLVTAINLTNSNARASDGRTLTSLLAARESLRTWHSILIRAADAAAGSWSQRQMRSELRQMSALPVKSIRAQGDEVARQLRELDVLIQRSNWETDLQE